MNAFSVDLEDWFHIIGIPKLENQNNWVDFESRIEYNTNKLLNIFSQYNIKVTFFVLGWVAEKYPDLVIKISEEGHEIGSHGYYHIPIFRLGRRKFIADAYKSKIVIEKVIKKKVRGYRAPSCSVTNATPWVFEDLYNIGYEYDSSVLPTPRMNGGMNVDSEKEFGIHYRYFKSNRLLEYPLSVSNFLGKIIPICGGGYFRIFPYWFTKEAIKNLNNKGQSAVLYIHPRDIDSGQPVVDMPVKRKIMSYTGISKCSKKLHNLLKDFHFDRLERVIDSNDWS